MPPAPSLQSALRPSLESPTQTHALATSGPQNLSSGCTMLPAHHPGGEGSLPCPLAQQACHLSQINCSTLKDLPICPWPHLPPWKRLRLEENLHEFGASLDYRVTAYLKEKARCPRDAAMYVEMFLTRALKACKGEETRLFSFFL